MLLVTYMLYWVQLTVMNTYTMLCGFDFYLKLSQILGFIPWINLNTFKLLDKIPYKMYPAAITILLLLPHYTKVISPKSVVDISVLTLTFTTGFSRFRSAYINRTEWKKLCQLYKVINKQIRPTFLHSLDLGVKHFVFPAIYILYLLTIRSVLYYNNVEKFNLLVDLLWLIKLTKECLTIYFLSILTKGFKMLNKHSKCLLTEGLISQVGYLIFNGTAQSFCRNLYSKLFEMSVSVNNIFGWMMATSLLDDIARMCLMIQNIINVTTKRTLFLTDVFLVILLITYRTVSNFIGNFKFANIKYEVITPLVRYTIALANSWFKLFPTLIPF